MRRSLLIICSLIGLLACKEEQLIVEKGSTELELVNGLLYYEDIPFDGLLVSKYDNGSLKMKLQYVGGRKDGFEKRWYLNGQLAQSRLYSKGNKIGNHLGWWEDGTNKFDYYFNAKGEYDGNRREWYRNGQLVRDFNYAKGKEVGTQRMWSSNGKIRANYEVKNGERFGLIGLKKCYSVKVDSNVL